VKNENFFEFLVCKKAKRKPRAEGRGPRVGDGIDYKGFMQCEHTKNAIVSFFLFISVPTEMKQRTASGRGRNRCSASLGGFAVGQLSDFSLCENRKPHPSNRGSTHPSFAKPPDICGRFCSRREKTRRGGCR
jgi:hypothetical protein